MSRRRGWLAGMVGVVLVVVISLVLRPLSYLDAVLRISMWRGGVRSRYVEVNGLRLHYFEVGSGSGGGSGGTPLVLVHGLGARGENWAKLMPDLAKAGFHVYAPDLPGYGRSARPDASYSISYEEAAVVGFMQAMRLPHADVAGWSMGGWVAMKLAADHPALVDKLVLYDSAGVYFPLDYETSLFTPTDAAGLDALTARLTPRRVQMPGFVARDFLRRSESNAWVLRRSLAAMTSGRELMDFRLGEIKAPTMVMWGMSDRLIPPESGEKIARGIAGAVFVPIDKRGGCGHLLPAECEAQMLPATVGFLRGGGSERAR